MSETVSETVSEAGSEGPVDGPLSQHRGLREGFERAREAHDGSAARFSMAQLALFGLSVVLGGSGLFGGALNWNMLGGGAAVFGVFLIVRMFQSRVMQKREAAEVRRELHDRHVKRITGRLSELPPPAATVPPGHPYASDLDIVGDASLLHRIDTTHTAAGAKTLTSWLAAPASREHIALRQVAVRELAPRVELRQELEAAVLDTDRERLDADPFVAMMAKPGILEDKPWLKLVAPVLPIVTVALLLTRYYVDAMPGWLFLIPLAAQMALVRMTGPRAREIYEAMGSKKGFVDAYRRLFGLVERTSFEAPTLVGLKKSLEIDGATPSASMRRLDRWVSWFELRETGIVHIVVNPLLLWDLNCLIGIERWIRTVGRKCGAWFEVLGELEALASLSVLLHQDLDARMPEIVPADVPFVAEGILHPLLGPESRVANDVELRGPGTCLIVTGSNMAGKSTLLRAVGVNIALALAGGPVTARSFRVPIVRLRASMRISDSLQSGASYFQAELSRLRLVVSRAEQPPPIFFLLDELLRGTNAKARHIGARAVVKHLLERDAMGFVATHDVALSELETEQPEHVLNVHFTDVIDQGVMTFDYKLRQGVVKTSNALRLLAQVGIEVEQDDAALSLTPTAEATADAR